MDFSTDINSLCPIKFNLKDAGTEESLFYFRRRKKHFLTLERPRGGGGGGGGGGGQMGPHRFFGLKM